MGDIGKDITNKIDDKLMNLDKELEALTTEVRNNESKHEDFNKKQETRLKRLKIDANWAQV